MIKLDRTAKPEFLSDDKVRELTDQYLSTKNSVWNKDPIKKALLALSNNKCAYCEVKIEIEDSYMEVEHFYPKSVVPSKVVCWDNLLPSCKKCNGNKGKHDTVQEPIINPFEIEPKDHLCVEAARLYPKSNSRLGEITINLLDLNDKKRLILPRFEVCDSLKENLENLNNSTVVDYKLRNKLRGILSACLSDKAYSGITSNTLQNDPYYHQIKEKLIENDLWNDDLNTLDSQTKQLALPSR